jgi:hypothetical protein
MISVWLKRDIITILLRLGRSCISFFNGSSFSTIPAVLRIFLLLLLTEVSDVLMMIFLLLLLSFAPINNYG